MQGRTQTTSLSLPFFDDFSYVDERDTPSNELWENSNNVYVNHNYTKDSPTIGVATFDEANEYGSADDYPEVEQGELRPKFDVLTSKPINLEEDVEGDIYLSFFVQPRGRFQWLNDTWQRDKLSLEFKACTGGECEWSNIADFVIVFPGNFLEPNEIGIPAVSSAALPGARIHAFTYYYVKIEGSQFLHSDFQFRLFNTSDNTAYNADPWHVDYVMLNNYNSPPEQPSFTDLAFVNRPENITYPLEKVPYSIMPWKEFADNITDYWTPQWEVEIANLSNSDRKIRFPKVKIQTNSGEELYNDDFADIDNQIILANSINNYTVEINPSALDLSLENPSKITTVFSFEEPVLDQTEPVENNQITKEISFQEILAYDDGTGELSNFNIPESHRVAVKFSIKKEAALSGIQMKLPEDFPVSSNKLLTVEIFKDVLDDSPEFTKSVMLSPGTEDFLTIPFTTTDGEGNFIIEPLELEEEGDFYISVRWRFTDSATCGSTYNVHEFGIPTCGGIMMFDNSKGLNSLLFESRRQSSNEWAPWNQISPQFNFESTSFEEQLYFKSLTPMIRAILSEEIVLEEISKYFTINLGLDDLKVCSGQDFEWDPRIYPNIEGCSSNLDFQGEVLADGGGSIGTTLAYDEAIGGYKFSTPQFINIPSEPGIYTIQLVVRDHCGGLGYATTTIEVLPLSYFEEDHIVCNNDTEVDPSFIITNVYTGELVESGSIFCDESPSVLTDLDVEFIAKEEVRLYEGFWAEEGSQFLARIGESDYPCPAEKNKNKNLSLASNIPDVESYLSLPEDYLQTKVYPNPTSGQLELSVNLIEDSSYYSITMYNVFGMKIGEKNIHYYPQQGVHKHSFDLSSQPAGIYIFQIETDQGYQLNKIIKS